MQSVSKNICPICGGTVVRDDKVLGYRSPKFSCRDCNAGLRAAPSWGVLWGFLVMAIGIPAVFLLDRLLPEFALRRTLLSVIFATVAFYTFKLTLDGFVFKPWRK